MSHETLIGKKKYYLYKDQKLGGEITPIWCVKVGA